MENLIPRAGDVLIEATHKSEEMTKMLNQGTWSYKNTKTGDINISVWFDIFLALGLLGMWVVQTVYTGSGLLPKSGEDRESRKESVKKFCLKGAKIGSTAMTTGVEFINKDEYSLILATVVICTIIFFKIIGGAEHVSAGWIFGAILFALFVRFTRQAGKGRVWFMLNTVLALVAVYLGMLGYTNSIPGRGSNEKSAQNSAFIFAGIFLLAAAFMKLVLTISPKMGTVTINTKTKTESEKDAYERYLDERAYAMVDGEWLYELTGLSAIVFGGSLTIFLFSMAITVSVGATKWYAVPYFALYPAAVYQFVLVCMDAKSQKGSLLPTVFNFIYVLLGFFILILLHGQTCSLPSSTLGEFATGEHPYCPRLGGLFRSDEHGVKLHVGWTIVLEVSAAIFITMAYSSMVFTTWMHRKTIDAVCGDSRLGNLNA